VRQNEIETSRKDTTSRLRFIMVASIARAISDEGHQGEMLTYLTFRMRTVAGLWIMGINLCAIQIFLFLTHMRITLAHECSKEISYLALQCTPKATSLSPVAIPRLT
jgi:hypothetical protein